MVAADTAEVKRSLKYYVNNFLSKEIGKTPLEHDKAFHPTNDDQERMMTSLFFHGGGGRACDWQKFETGGISGVY